MTKIRQQIGNHVIKRDNVDGGITRQVANVFCKKRVATEMGLADPKRLWPASFSDCRPLENDVGVAVSTNVALKKREVPLIRFHS